MKTTIVSVLLAAVVVPLTAVAVSALAITDPSVTAARFSPSKGESVEFAYALSEPAKVRIRVYSPDDTLVRAIVNWEARSAGKHKETWDGKDSGGKIVPDEAYYFTVEARGDKGAASTYDPVQASGGDELELTDLKYDAESREIVFSLKNPSRIMVRAGIAGGPLMATPVDWMAFDKGTQRVAWAGKDESANIEVGTRDDLKLYGIGYLLSNCNVVTVGNERLTYRDYMSVLPRTVYRKPGVTPSVRKVAISPFWGRSPRYSRAIRFAMGEPKMEKGKLTATVTLPPDEVALLRGVAYEIIAYVDNDLLLDDERGHTPYALSLDLSKVSPGEHVLTVNVASVTDRVGTQTAVFAILLDK